MSYKMRKVIENLLTENKMTFRDLKKVGAIKIKNEPYMDLNIDYLGKSCGMDEYAVAHNFIQQGDVMSDPDMNFFHFGASRDDHFNEFYPSSYQSSPLGLYERTVECRDGKIVKPLGQKRARDLIKFAEIWATNLRRQGFIKGECTADGKACKELKYL